MKLFCRVCVTVLAIGLISGCGKPDSSPPNTNIQAKSSAANLDTAPWDQVIQEAARRNVLISFGTFSDFFCNSMYVETNGVGFTEAEILSAIELLQVVQAKVLKNPYNPAGRCSNNHFESNASRAYSNIVILQDLRKKLILKEECPKPQP